MRVRTKTAIRSWFLAGVLAVPGIAGARMVEEYCSHLMGRLLDSFDVEASYRGASVRYVVDTDAKLQDDALVSTVRAGMKQKIRNEECQPHWNDARLSFSAECIGPIKNTLNEITLKPDDKKKVHELWSRLNDIQNGSLPDSFYVEIKALVVNHGENRGNVNRAAAVNQRARVGQKSREIAKLDAVDGTPLTIGGTKSTESTPSSIEPEFEKYGASADICEEFKKNLKEMEVVLEVEKKVASFKIPEDIPLPRRCRPEPIAAGADQNE